MSHPLNISWRTTLKRGTCVAALILASSSSAVFSQTVQPTPTATPANLDAKAAIETALQEKLFSASTKSLTQLIEQQAMPLEMSFKRLPDLPDDVSTTGVTIKGYTQFVEVDGQKVGQLILTGLEKDNKAASLDPNKFTAQFDLENAELPTEKALDIKGDRDELVAALRKLNEKDAPVEEEEKEKAEAAEKPTSAVQNEAKNDQASNYKTPERREAKPDPKEELRVTTEGCNVRVDISAGKAVQQSKVQTFKDGVLSEDGSCSDSDPEYLLKKSYDVCRDKVDLDAKVATAQFTWYYVNEQQARVDVSECQPDAEKVFGIVEKHSCAIDIDLDNKLATPQSKLIYVGMNNLEEQVRDCEASVEKPAVPLVLSTDTCSIKHNFGGNKSSEMGMYSYTLDGAIFQATPCLETGVQFNHTKLYKYDGGGDVCAPILDLANKTATRQYRVQITNNGQDQFITECTPDESGSLAVTSTTETCENPINFEHDIAAGISYGKERFYYENPNRVYVTECQKSEVSYEHSVETVGWQNHDDIKSSYPLSTVKITANSQPFIVTQSIVLPGETFVPYVFNRTGNEVVSAEYTGCFAVKQTADVEVYLRPDTTEFKQSIGTGDPIGPIDTCGTIITQPIWEKISQTGVYKTGQTSKAEGGMNCGSQGEHQCYQAYTTWARAYTLKGKRVLQREDGEQITQASKTTRSVACTGTQVKGTRAPSLGNCPATYTGGSVYAWNQAEAW